MTPCSYLRNIQSATREVSGENAPCVALLKLIKIASANGLRQVAVICDCVDAPLMKLRNQSIALVLRIAVDEIPQIVFLYNA